MNTGWRNLIWIIALIGLTTLAMVPMAQATSTGVGDYAGLIYPGIMVEKPAHQAYNFGPDSVPTNNLGCQMSQHHMFDMESWFDAIFSWDEMSNLITVSPRDSEDVWAIADCMANITVQVENNWPWVDIVVFDLSLVFYDGPASHLLEIHEFINERAQAWWQRA